MESPRERRGLASRQSRATVPLTSLYDLLTRVGHHLDQSEISWALVGGLAVGARTEPRFTRDVDLAIAVDDDRQAEQVVKTMLELGYQLSALLEEFA